VEGSSCALFEGNVLGFSKV